MELTFDVRIAVGDLCSESHIFSVDYDATKEDIEDFVKDQNCDSVEGLIKAFSCEDDCVREELDHILTELEKDNAYPAEMAIRIDLDLEKEFHDFLVSRLQGTFEDRLSSSMHLIDTSGINLNY